MTGELCKILTISLSGLKLRELACANQAFVEEFDTALRTSSGGSTIVGRGYRVYLGCAFGWFQY